LKLTHALLAIILVQTFCLNTSLAANVTTHARVTVIYPQGGNSDVLFKTEGNGCGFVHANHYFRLASDHPTFDETYALILASANAEKTIYVRYDDAACSTSILATTINYVYQSF